MFLALILFGALTNSATQGTVQYDECKALKFEPKACWNSEQLHKAGKFLCKVQGKELEGRSDCK